MGKDERGRQIRLAVVFDQEVLAGGGYQQALNAALILKKLPDDLVSLSFISTAPGGVKTLAANGIDAKFVRLGLFHRVFNLLARQIRRLGGGGCVSTFERRLLRERIDLVYFLSPSPLARDLHRLNYLWSVWDFCHREDLEFPEVRCGQFQSREAIYHDALLRAAAVFVESPYGKECAARWYGVDSRRIHILPFEPAIAVRNHAGSGANSADVNQRYGLSVPYVFYPAQFWPHKNHVYILEGLAELEKRHGIVVGAIFSGGNKGNLDHVIQCATRLGVAERIRIAGFVNGEDLAALYQGAIALVMPTYFGPTNLPPLEAFSLGVPVIYPDKDGLRDQVGDAALLIDLDDPASLAEHLASLVGKDGLRQELVVKGRARLHATNQVDRADVIGKVLRNFWRRRSAWGADFRH